MNGMQLLKPYYYDLTLRIVNISLWIAVIKDLTFPISFTQNEHLF